jgi:hypothetical protein
LIDRKISDRGCLRTQTIYARVGHHAYYEKLVIPWRCAVANPMAEGALIAEELSGIGAAEDRDLL